MTELESKILVKLRSRLRRGDMKKIADIAGCSANFVSMVLRGIQYSDKVIHAAVKVASERNKMREKTIETINNLP